MGQCRDGVKTCFNPRPLCRERRRLPACSSNRILVSIHAPYAGSDPDSGDIIPLFTVSIHAPYAGSDSYPGNLSLYLFGFNPRPLCRERQQFQPKILPYFQQKSTNYHFKYLNFPFFIPSSSTKHAVCAHLRVRIPRHFYVRFLFALLYYHKINVSSTAIPRSTPICSTFV